MKEIKICVEWGYWHAYFDKKYCAKMDFSGNVEVTEGCLKSLEKIEFKYDDWGPHVFSKNYSKLPGKSWNSVILKWMEGVRITVDADDNTTILINTTIKKIEFTIFELKQKKHIVFNAGSKYSCAVIHVEIDDDENHWFTPELESGQTLVGFKEFKNAPAVDFFTVAGAMVATGKSAKAEFGLKLLDAGKEYSIDKARLRVRYLINKRTDEESKIRGIARFSVLINDKKVWENSKFGMWHDCSDQLLEEVWSDIDYSCLKEGINSVEIINEDDNINVVVQNLLIELKNYEHLSVVSRPEWVLVGKPFSITIRANCPSSLFEIKYDESIFLQSINGITEDEFPLAKKAGSLIGNLGDEQECLSILEGDNEFFFTAKKVSHNAYIEFRDKWRNISTKVFINQIWDLSEEEIPFKTGFEIRTGSPYEYLEILKDAYGSQLGNLAVYRDYHNKAYHPSVLWDSAEYCRKHEIYTDCILVDEQMTVARASGVFCHCVGTHEHTGIFYGRDEIQDISVSMRNSMDQAVCELSAVVSNFSIGDIPVAVGDASGGARYAYAAGFDIIRHETFVGHHTLMLTTARGAAKAFGVNDWGVHVASQHNAHPELEAGLRRFWLGLYMPWVYGCNFAFEEDSLYQLFKYVRNTGRDYMTKGKYDITREFHKYTSINPREGKPKVDFAILQGRYAPPFNGISCVNNGNENDIFVNERFPVWGHTGRRERNWGFCQPEKGYHFLELFAPGIFLTPLSQDTKRIRKFFSGNPHGEFDQLPVEAPVESYKDYKFVALLCWHTMDYAIKEEIARNNKIHSDYKKFYEYVKSGGILFLSVPHLTTRDDRNFLDGMDDLKLYNKGDVRDLCGLKIHGKSDKRFSAAVVAEGFADEFTINDKLDIIRTADESNSDSPCFIAAIELFGAEVVIKDDASGMPLLTKHNIGKGCVYLLCTYAYPGNEELMHAVSDILLSIVEKVEKERKIYVKDTTGEIYWSVREKKDGTGRIYLLNTDWTEANNVKQITIVNSSMEFPFTVREGELAQITYFQEGMIYSKSQDLNIGFPHKDNGDYVVKIQCFNGADINIFAAHGLEVYIDGQYIGKASADERFSFDIKQDTESASHFVRFSLLNI